MGGRGGNADSTSTPGASAVPAGEVAVKRDIQLLKQCCLAWTGCSCSAATVWFAGVVLHLSVQCAAAVVASVGCHYF